MGRLDGKIALVTGAARGMGAEHVRHLVAHGARVMGADVRDEQGQDLADELGEGMIYRHLDVRSASDWRSAVEVAERELGPIEVLVNNAGIGGFGAIDTFPADELKEILGVNLIGPFNGIQAVLPGMRRLGRGSIINISSVGGLRGFASVSGYCASKFALTGLTKCVALELAPVGIRVNSVHPGKVVTAMARDPNVATIALGRRAQPIEIANTIVFLASDESSFTTGTQFVIDGADTDGL